jgi:hypothetical protein
MGDQNTRSHKARGGLGRRTGTAGLLLVWLGLLVGLHPSSVGATRRDTATGAAVPFPSLHRKALLSACRHHRQVWRGMLSYVTHVCLTRSPPLVVPSTSRGPFPSPLPQDTGGLGHG